MSADCWQVKLTRISLPQQMALIYENGLSAAVGPVAEEMRYGLAEHFWSQGKREPALKMYKEIASLQKGNGQVPHACG